MPWGSYDTAGRLRIGYFDRSYDAANHKFGYSLAADKTAGSLAFTSAQLTTQLSDPTMGDLWFSFIPVDPNFPRATSFLGDYSGIAADPEIAAGLVTPGAGSSPVAPRQTTCKWPDLLPTRA